MTCNYKFVSVLMLLLLFSLSSIQNSPAGSRQDQMTYFGIGARAMALNGAYTAISNDYTAQFWNPGAMDFFSTTKIGAMVTQMSLNRELRYASATVPTHRWGAFAVGWSGFSVEGIEARSSNTPQPDRLFDYEENTFYLSYAYRIFPFLALGANLKFFYFQSLNATANGSGVDLGLLFAMGRKVRLGLVSQNLNSKLNWSSATREKFIPNYRVGLAVAPIENLLLAADYHYFNQDQATLSFASEIVVLHLLKFRCGIAQNRFTAGLGVTVQTKGLFLNFNYAVATDRFDLGVSDGLDMSLVF